MEQREYVPTPEQFMAFMEQEGINIHIVPGLGHKLYYVYPRDEITKFTLDVMGIPCTNEIASYDKAKELVSACNAWEGTMNSDLFEAWRMDFNKRNMQQIPRNI